MTLYMVGLLVLVFSSFLKLSMALDAANACKHRFSCEKKHVCSTCERSGRIRQVKFCRKCNLCNFRCNDFLPDQIIDYIENSEHSVRIVSPFLSEGMVKALYSHVKKGLEITCITRLYIEDLLAHANSLDALNGRIVVDMFKEHDPGYYDAILMDVRMPEMDGLEAAETIRALDRPDARSIPIIAMTANAFDEDVQFSMQAGMNAHLSKPVEPDRLFSTLEELI